jgi:hypothetical protein
MGQCQGKGSKDGSDESLDASGTLPYFSRDAATVSYLKVQRQDTPASRLSRTVQLKGALIAYFPHCVLDKGEPKFARERRLIIKIHNGWRCDSSGRPHA